MSKKIKVHFTGIENNGWALDEIQRIAIELTKEFVEPVPIEAAEIIHSAWWDGLRNYSVTQLNGKRLICDFDNPVTHWLTQPSFQPSFDMNINWVVYSSQSRNELKQYMGCDGFFVPFRFDEKLFFPVENENLNRISISKKLKLHSNKYIIGNFQRDTDGANLSNIKVQKAPELFLEIVLELHRKGLPIHILLAGPRRHWIIKQFEKYEVPYTYFGKKMINDDFSINRLDRSTLNILYSFLDLCLITSRWEGGPYAITEAVMAQTKILSSRVGIAEDVLNHNCLYNSVEEAISIIERDIVSKTLDCHVLENKKRLLEGFGKESVQNALIELYKNVLETPVFDKNNLSPEFYNLFGQSHLLRFFTAIKKKFSFGKVIQVISNSDSNFFKEVKQELECSFIRMIKYNIASNAPILFCSDDLSDENCKKIFINVHNWKLVVINDAVTFNFESAKLCLLGDFKRTTYIFKNRDSLKTVAHLFAGKHVLLWEGLQTRISGEEKINKIIF